jgi:ubiquitin carboxyl-terminal hydrolase 7
VQDARKGVLFDDFPPVLQLQLKRFEYDFQRDTMVKVSAAGHDISAAS